MYQKEELEQLERMYKADDLTEETEEIILTRAQHGVDAAKYRLKKAIAAQDRFLNVVLPRQAEDFRHREQQAAPPPTPRARRASRRGRRRGVGVGGADHGAAGVLLFVSRGHPGTP